MKPMDFLINETLQKLELLAHDTKSVLWANDPSYKKLLFVSNNYQTIWQRSSISIYRNLFTWRSYLVKDQQEHLPFSLIHRNTPINPKHTEQYCFLLPNGATQWCLDRSFSLFDEQNCIMIAGVALPVSEKQLTGKENIKISDELDKIIVKYYQLLTADDKKGTIVKNSTFHKTLDNLTSREKQILELILHNLTAKKIAKKLGISPRTVEEYTDTIKNKFSCDSKSELISKAIENNYIRVLLG